ncbi:metalloprotease [Mycena vitilis]|nr:metalloprotease [Mycena vitilis]
MLRLLVPLSLLFGDALASASTARTASQTSAAGVYFPSSTYQSFGGGMGLPMQRRDANLADNAASFVATQLKINATTVNYKSGYSADGVQYAYLHQQHNDIPFANAVANVALKGGKVVSFGTSFIKPGTIAPSSPTVPVPDAIFEAEAAFKGRYNQIPTLLEYLVNPDHSVSLVHVVQVQNETDWHEIFVDAHSGKFVGSINLVAEAWFRVVPWYEKDPTHGFDFFNEFLVADSVASPNWWDTDVKGWTDVTRGNNGCAFLDRNESKVADGRIWSPDGSTTITSSFTWIQDPMKSPSAPVNLNASRVNVFYMLNIMHDISYRFGFTEAAFNFQTTNPNGQGKSNDSVKASCQDSQARGPSFGTPPDGQSGNMYLTLTGQQVKHDSSFANDVIVHEYTHGITNRMTGGGTGRCLQTPASRALGEGWSDAFADWAAQLGPAIQDFTLGSYINDGVPIRTYPYSTNLTVNPLQYQDALKLVAHPHDAGEVWANLLHNVHADLVTAHGFRTYDRDPSGTEGNIVFLHLFMDGLALQPCNPSFIQARDAFLLADENRYQGAHRCLLWETFANRGMGMNAMSANNYAVPGDCRARRK